MRILYHTPLCPYSRKIRLLLKEKELSFQLVAENVWDRRTAFFALNPAGEVPVLVEADDTVIAGDYALTEYLEEAYPQKMFTGGSLIERAEIRRITEWFDSKFYHEVTLNLLVEKIFKRLQGYGEPNSEAIRAGRKNIYYHLDYLSHLLTERHFLAGETLSLADITAAAHLSSLDYISDVPWEYRASVKNWYALIKSRPAFRTILTDRFTGFRPPEHYENPDF